MSLLSKGRFTAEGLFTSICALGVSAVSFCSEVTSCVVRCVLAPANALKRVTTSFLHIVSNCLKMQSQKPAIGHQFHEKKLKKSRGARLATALSSENNALRL